MRVAHIITRLIIGGAQENTILNCQDLIRDYGDEVMLIAGPGLGPEGSLEEDARRREIPLRMVRSMRRSIHPWRDYRTLRELRAALREFHPDVVHTHSGKAGLLGRYAAWQLNVPAIVHTVHGAPFHAYQPWAARKFFRRCEIFAAKRCHAIISVADAMTEQLVAAGVASREKFTTIYSGMEVEPFLNAEQHRRRVRQELGFSEEHVVVGKIARLFHLKGHSDVLRAALTLAEKFPHVRYLFVGDGILREGLQRAIDRTGLGDRFRFTGLVSPERIPELIAATDLIVHASYREGLARVLPQALLAGRPVVSYDIDGAREVVVEDETGFLVAPGDAGGLAGAIAKLAADVELRRRLAATGRQRCREQFDHRRMTRQIRALYESLLRKKNSLIGYDAAGGLAYLLLSAGTDFFQAVASGVVSQAIDLSEWLAGNPVDVLATNLDLPRDVADRLPKTAIFADPAEK